MNRRIALFATIIFALLLLCACREGIREEDAYTELNEGMSSEEVREIMGEPDSYWTGSTFVNGTTWLEGVVGDHWVYDLPNHEKVVLMIVPEGWEEGVTNTSNGTLRAVVHIMKNGTYTELLYNKVLWGPLTNTLEDFKKLKMNMSREEVEAILGEPQYIWGSMMRYDIYLLLDGSYATLYIEEEEGMHTNGVGLVQAYFKKIDGTGFNLLEGKE
ncbi:hypothetical protein LJC20_07060 [Eubacteriales bacterium OttesenSCG-928-M02]|nr:hypothetical protein [Eubacteriales bacterium OttesenSCG-928-M02]